MKKFLFYTLISVSFFSNSVFAGKGDTVRVQLLLDDGDVRAVKSAARTHELQKENQIPHQHISVLEVSDPDDKIKNDFKPFVEKVQTVLLAGQSLAEKKQQPFSFSGKGVKGYQSQDTGQTYWCLEKDSEKNKYLGLVARGMKKQIEKWLGIDTTSSTAGELKSPDQVVQGISDKAEEDSRSFVEFSKGFPHISLAKGAGLEEHFSALQNQPFEFKIKGVNFVYSFGVPMPELRIPQIFISSDLGTRSVNFSSYMRGLSYFNGSYQNLDQLFNDQQGVSGVLIQRSAHNALKYVTQKVINDLAEKTKQSQGTLKRKEPSDPRQDREEVKSLRK